MRRWSFYVSLTLFAQLAIASIQTDGLPKLEPVKGTKYSDVWKGTFRVTKCILCENFQLPNGANFKNLTEFGFDFAIVSPENLPECARTNLAAAQYFKITSDDGTIVSLLSKTYGMCDWSPTRNYQFLDLSDDFFHYRQQKRDSSSKIISEETFTIDRISENRYLVHRIVENPEAASGMPKRFVYLFEAEKITSAFSSYRDLKSRIHASAELK